MDDRGRYADVVLLTSAHRARLPRHIQARIRDLDSYLSDVLAAAVEGLLIVSPYLGPAGMEILRGPIAAAAQRGVWIRLVTSDLDEIDGMNRRALAVLLEGWEGAIIRQRLRLLSGGRQFPVLLHAKIVVADGRYGYLGSANLSARAFNENFEVGAPLSSAQARTLADLVAYLEAEGLLIDRSALLD